MLEGNRTEAFSARRKARKKKVKQPMYLKIEQYLKTKDTRSAVKQSNKIGRAQKRRQGQEIG